MPTVLRIDGFRVAIYPNDHLPAHVHVIRAGGEVRIDLAEGRNSPILVSVLGSISNKDAIKALKLVTENRLFLLNKWKEIHD
ncbi:DUF4160 domain-containing protein [Synechococcus sp. PCC 7336]|uniref:DUF4160 domain-containing protein n=1 Tax=Synechococcus sp. PCC 7336 TaxID=195250 RepID=UPI00034BDF46|nr:DUF4160 domain-containing protein [Synechococcus sp. PCC 7336]